MAMTGLDIQREVKNVTDLTTFQYRNGLTTTLEMLDATIVELSKLRKYADCPHGEIKEECWICEELINVE